MPSSILVLNAGSSSLKAGVFEATRPDAVLAQGIVRRVGSDAAGLELQAFGQTMRREDSRCPDHAAALRLLLDALEEAEPGWSGQLRAVGHRVVHGGSLYTEPTMITARVEAALDALRELAPLHNGRAVAVLKAALAALPHVPQVACFDTMFHAQLPEVTARYALPRAISDRFGIRRYGFHGLSCAWSMSRLRAIEGHVPGRVVICHLGAGASVTAVRDGRSADTTMGFTPLEGLIMATRSGSIDPSIVLYLQRHAGMGVDEVQRLLEEQSGLLGLSEKSGDVQILEGLAKDGDRHAEEALSAFAYKVRLAIGALWAALGGLDVLVLTGGIGEHSAEMRRRILKPLGALGVELDEAANGDVGTPADEMIGVAGREPEIWVIHAKEEQVIAVQVARLLK